MNPTDKTDAMVQAVSRGIEAVGHAVLGKEKTKYSSRLGFCFGVLVGVL
jgi:hypothetical protein